MYVATQISYKFVSPLGTSNANPAPSPHPYPYMYQYYI